MLNRMSDTTTELPALPPANEDIRLALAEVDARLSAWVAAMTAAHAALAERSCAQTVAAQPPVQQAPAPPKAETVPAERAPVTPVVSPEPQPEPEPEPETRQAPAPAADHSREEDEALLASLDPETAKAIRVMRRLSFEKKSVRELLEEYTQSGQPQEKAEQRQRKSWW
jgi:hypothetical protein